MFSANVDEELQLALVRPEFAAEYLRLVTTQRDYLSQWLAWPKLAHDEDFFLNFVKKSLHDYAEGHSMVCAMLYQGKLVGNISFNHINPQLEKVTIGYWLSQDDQGKGIVSRALNYLIAYAFDTLEIQKIEISVAVDNLPSRKVCERLGMQLEGTITRSENLNGRIVDHCVYGLQRPLCDF